MGSDRRYYISRDVVLQLENRFGKGQTMDLMLRELLNVPRQPKKKADKKSKYKYFMADLAVGESREFPQTDTRDRVTGLDHKTYYAVHRSSLAQQKKYNMTFDISWGSTGIKITRLK